MMKYVKYGFMDRATRKPIGDVEGSKTPTVPPGITFHFRNLSESTSSDDTVFYGTVENDFRFHWYPMVEEITEDQFIRARHNEYNKRIEWLKDGQFFDVPEGVELNFDQCKYALRRYVDKIRDRVLFVAVPYVFPGDEILAKQIINFESFNLPEEIEGNDIKFNIDENEVIYTITDTPSGYPNEIEYDYMDVLVEDMADTLQLSGYAFSQGENNLKSLIIEQIDGHGKEISEIFVYSDTMDLSGNVSVEVVDTRDAVQLRDERDRQNIQDNAIDSLGSDPEDIKVFMSQNNVAKYLTSTQMFQMAKFLKSRGDNVYTAAWQKKNEIEMCTTYEELKNIDFETGWPVD